MVLVKADGTLKSPLKKLLSVTAQDELLHKTGAQPGDLLLIAASSLDTVVAEPASNMMHKGQEVGCILFSHSLLYFVAPSAGLSSSAVRGAAGVLRRRAPGSLCLPLPVGGGLSPLLAPRGETGGAGVSSSSLHCCAA